VELLNIFITKPASVDKESSVQFHQGHENESVAGLALNISPPLELPGNISNDLFEIQFTAPSTTTGITQVPEYSCETVPENDAALWPPNTKSVIDYWLQMGPESCRNRDGIYANSVRECTDKNRKLNDSAFFTDSPNGEKNDRHWLLYSPSTGRVFFSMVSIFGSTTVSANQTIASPNVANNEGIQFAIRFSECLRCCTYISYTSCV
jgi:hypothetical protein